jgi:enamine deaminase RidA (YjgF/YER057c/UK114 family)
MFVFCSSRFITARQEDETVMIKSLSTDKAPPAFSRYSQAVEIAAGSRLVVVSGQVGVDLDGKLAATSAGQHEQTWANLLAILAAQGLGPADIAEVTAYLTDPGDVGLYREVRDRMLAGAAPASTLIIVAGLADPRWRVEIAVVAAAKA